MLKSLKRERLLVVSNIAVMTLTFVILGVFITVFAISQTALRTLEKQAQVTMFFKDDFPEERILELKTTLENDQRILEANYVSKEQAYALFKELNKDDEILLENLTANILPASLEVKTKSLDDLPVIAEELSVIDGVEEVSFFRDVIDNFRRWTNIAYTVGLAMVMVFVAISFAVIMITLRLTINSKGHELEILKLVGASDDYVRKPLVQQGIFFGLVSGLISSVILIVTALLIQFAGVFTQKLEFSFLPDVLVSMTVFIILLSFVLITLGFTLGYIGSITAIKRYLKY